MRKTILLVLFVLALFPFFIHAQESNQLDAESLLPMYRTWVKMLFIVIVILSTALLILGIKFLKLKQQINTSKKNNP